MTKDERKEYMKAYYQKNKEKILNYAKERNKNNKEYIKKYQKDNQDKIKKHQEDYRKKNRDKLIEYNRKYQREYSFKKYKSDSTYRINKNMSRVMSHHLKNNKLSKNGRHWEGIVGYTTQELKKHLEKLFTEGMTWQNYGKWHIDHIVPRSFFKYDSTNHWEFKYCWSLNNLQPLWAEDNLSKGKRLLQK